jgi:hypothetical protein
VVHLDPAARTVGVATDGSAAQVRALLDQADPRRDMVASFAVRGATLDDVFLTLTAPLSYASSAFVPVRTMSWWLRGFARHQPVTPVTETLRGLLLGQPTDGQLATALAWSGGILAGSILLSMLLFRRRTA